MPKHDRSSITKGMFMTRDGPGPAAIKYNAPPPRYGEPAPFKPTVSREISTRIDEARKRIEELARQVSTAKRR